MPKTPSTFTSHLEKSGLLTSRQAENPTMRRAVEQMISQGMKKRYSLEAIGASVAHYLHKNC